MTEMFRVTPIEGKGFGVVATKFIKRGTLILKEEPQIPNVEWPTSMKVDLWKRCIKTLIKLFYQMSESNQDEYLKLYNRFSFEDSIQLDAVMALEKDQQKAEKILKILGIYRTNQFEDGFRIKTSRFNHSCSPNALIDPQNRAEIYATYDIAEGAEITISYGVDVPFFSMRKRVYRQTVLGQMNFTCCCDLCKKQDQIPPEVNQTEIETKIEELIEKIDKLNVDRSAALMSTTPMMAYLQFPPDKCRRQIECYKQMYKFGKERKAHRGDMYCILEKGFRIASLEYLICLDNKKFKEMEEFKIEGINFAKSAEGFAKVLGEGLVQPEEWKKVQQNFEKNISDVLSQK